LYIIGTSNRLGTRCQGEDGFVGGHSRTLLIERCTVKLFQRRFEGRQGALELPNGGYLGVSRTLEPVELTLLRRLLRIDQRIHHGPDIHAGTETTYSTYCHFCLPNRFIDGLASESKVSEIKQKPSQACLHASVLNSRLRASDKCAASSSASSDGICRITSPVARSVTLTTTRPLSSSSLKAISLSAAWATSFISLTAASRSVRTDSAGCRCVKIPSSTRGSSELIAEVAAGCALASVACVRLTPEYRTNSVKPGIRVSIIYASQTTTRREDCSSPRLSTTGCISPADSILPAA